jgi:hypothetical protein
MTVDTEAITARYYDEPDPFFPGERTVVIPRPAEVLRDIAALLAEVARLREALRAFVESDAIVNYDSSLCWGCGGTRHERYETSPLDEHDANCILARGRAALQAVEETP